MKILVTGSSGFIGTFLVRELVRDGYQVIGMDMHAPEEKELNYEFIRGDILMIPDIMRAAKGVDAIINLAAKHHDFGVSREEFFAVNGQGTKNILDCASQLGIKKFIFYSTVAVYGNHEPYPNEDTATRPVNVYGKSKLEGERFIRDWASKDGGNQAVIIRPTVVFGPENYANMHSLISSIYKKKFFFVGKGNNIKSVVYVENLVDATIFLLGRMKPGVDVYNYVDYPQMSIRDTVNIICRCLSRDIPKLTMPLRPALAAAGIFDILGKLIGYNFPITAFRIKKFNTETCFAADKIRAAGFKPRIALEDGFRNMVEWYLSREARGEGG